MYSPAVNRRVHSLYKIEEKIPPPSIYQYVSNYFLLEVLSPSALLIELNTTAMNIGELKIQLPHVYWHTVYLQTTKLQHFFSGSQLRVFDKSTFLKFGVQVSLILKFPDDQDSLLR